MDMILNELHRNSVDINIDTLRYYIESIKKEHEFIYRAVDEKSFELREMFYEKEVNNFGRFHLTFVYVSNRS